jgi:hypothetical protein
MWNSTFGTKTQLIYPPALKAALEQLQPFVDIELPSFGIRAGDLDIADQPAFADNQDDDAEGLSGFIEVSNDNSKCAGTRTLLSPLAWNSNASGSRSSDPQVTKTTNDRTPVGSSTKRKRRHDDSQVQYVVIESSPQKDAENGSQYLTDRQKEVRSRRQAEPAVVFPDLRSSPLLSNAPLTPTRKKNFNIDLKQTERAEIDGPATPTLPVLVGEGADEEMASSPTPQSKQPVLRLDDIEVPSSPPSMPGCAEQQTSPEHIYSQEDILQNALFDDQTDNQSTPPRLYGGNETPAEQAGGNTFPSPEHQQNFDDPDMDKMHNDGDRADAWLNKHLQERGELNVESPGVGTVVESVEFSHDRTFMHLARRLEEEMQSKDVHQSPGLEESLGEEIKKEAWSPRESIQHDVGMAAGVASASHSDPGQADEGTQKEEEFCPERNVCNIPPSDLRAVLGSEAACPAVSDRCCVIGRHSPAVSHNSHIDSEEVDMLSASQLSQDLDWHVALEQRTSQTDESPEAEGKRPVRKRKRFIGYFPSPKRRKSTCSPSDRGRQILGRPSGTHQRQVQKAEIFDCIVLDTTPQLQKAADQPSQRCSDAVTIKHSPKKRGGKPKQCNRTLEDRLTSGEDSGSMLPPEVVPKGETIPLEDEGLSEGGASSAFSGSRLMSSPRTAPTSIGDGENRRTPTEGSTDGVSQALGTRVISNSCSVAPTSADTAAASTRALSEPFEPPSIRKVVRARFVSPPQMPGDAPEIEPGPDMAKRAVCKPAQQAYLPSQTTASQHGLETQANTHLEVGTLEKLGGAISLEMEGDGMVDVICPLQQVLEQLKSAKMEKRTLREIEDLLFEIRTEAQYAVGRLVSGQ